MPRILSIDYGLKRTGIAVTDPFQIIATGLTTVESKQLIPFLRDYFSKEEVEMIIIGEPKNWDDTDTHATPLVEKCIVELKKNFPSLPIQKVDERYTSKMATFVVWPLIAIQLNDMCIDKNCFHPWCIRVFGFFFIIHTFKHLDGIHNE